MGCNSTTHHFRANPSCKLIITYISLHPRCALDNIYRWFKRLELIDPEIDSKRYIQYELSWMAQDGLFYPHTYKNLKPTAKRKRRDVAVRTYILSPAAYAKIERHPEWYEYYQSALKRQVTREELWQKYQQKQTQAQTSAREQEPEQEQEQTKPNQTN